MIKNIDNLADRLKGIKVNGEDVTPSKLTELLSSEQEHELTIDEVHFFNNDELSQLKNNSYKDGLIFGTEKLVKSFRDVNELDFEGKIKYDGTGRVDYEALAKHISEPLQEKVKKTTTKPTEEIKEWESKYTTLKTTYETEKKAYDSQITELNSRLGDINKTQFLMSSMPDLTGIKKEQAIVLFKNDYIIEQKENGFVAKKNGEIIKDKTGNPLPIKEIANLWAVDNGWLKEAGAGGGNEPGGTNYKFKTEEEAYSYMRKNNIQPGSDEAEKLLKQVAPD